MNPILNRSEVSDDLADLLLPNLAVEDLFEHSGPLVFGKLLIIQIVRVQNEGLLLTFGVERFNEGFGSVWLCGFSLGHRRGLELFLVLFQMKCLEGLNHLKLYHPFRVMTVQWE
jgi:hypothetical protein